MPHQVPSSIEGLVYNDRLDLNHDGSWAKIITIVAFERHQGYWLALTGQCSYQLYDREEHREFNPKED